MSEIGPTLITIVVSVIGLAMLAVAVGQKAQTSSVIQAGGTALSSVIGAAVAPVSGSQSSSFGSTTSIGGMSQ